MQEDAGESLADIEAFFTKYHEEKKRSEENELDEDDDEVGREGEDDDHCDKPDEPKKLTDTENICVRVCRSRLTRHVQNGVDKVAWCLH